MLKVKSTQQQKSNVRKSTTLPAETVEYLKNWMMSPEHINHPYPTEREKAQIMADTGIGIKPLTNWFVNNRKRYWKPRYEARLQQQKAEAAKAKMAGGNAALGGVPSTASAVITASPALKSTNRQFLGRGRRVSIDGGSRNGFNSPTMTSPPYHHASPSARAVSIGSASSLSSELSDGNSFDDDDSVCVSFASPERKVRKRQYHIGIIYIGRVPCKDLLTFPSFCHISLQVEIILDLKRSRCSTLNGSDDEHSYEGQGPSKRCRTTPKKVTVHRIPHHEAPRSEYVGKDTTQWTSVCGNAGNGFEHALPTLEEAALMFGHNQ